MVQAVNLADASFEPTDEQLVELVVEAFGPVQDAADEALQRFRDEIAKLRKRAIERVEQGGIVESA